MARRASQWGTLSHKESKRVAWPKILVYTDISKAGDNPDIKYYKRDDEILSTVTFKL